MEGQPQTQVKAILEQGARVALRQRSPFPRGCYLTLLRGHESTEACWERWERSCSCGHRPGRKGQDLAALTRKKLDGTLILGLVD
jgi:hypothetical protein